MIPEIRRALQPEPKSFHYSAWPRSALTRKERPHKMSTRHLYHTAPPPRWAATSTSHDHGCTGPCRLVPWGYHGTPPPQRNSPWSPSSASCARACSTLSVDWAVEGKLMQRRPTMELSPSTAPFPWSVSLPAASQIDWVSDSLWVLEDWDIVSTSQAYWATIITVMPRSSFSPVHYWAFARDYCGPLKGRSWWVIPKRTAKAGTSAGFGWSSTWAESLAVL